MEEKIRNVYLMNYNQDSKMFVFSVADSENPLKFDYYILYLDRELKPCLIKTNNTLQSLKDTETKIIKIEKDDQLYDQFKAYLLRAKGRNIEKQSNEGNDISYIIKKDSQ